MKKTNGIMLFICLLAVTFLGGSLEASAATAQETVYLNETFGTPQEVLEQDLTTSKTEGYNDWRITYIHPDYNFEQSKADGVEFLIIPEDDQNNVLHLKRDTYGSTKPQLVAGKKVTGVPGTDSVKISWQMKYSNTTHALVWDGVFSVIGHNKVQMSNGHTFEPVGTEQIAALNTKDVWHTYELVVNYTVGTTTLYVDSIQIGNAANSTFALSQISFYLPRNNKDSVGNVYIDDLKVVHIPDPEWVSFSEISNGQEAGNVSAKLDLIKTKNEYSIEWTSSKPTVISTNGDVVVPSFFDEKVTLTAKVTMTATGASVGTCVFDVVVPCSAETVWNETFGTPAEVSPQPLSQSKTSGYNDWRLTSDGYEDAKNEGTEFNIIKESDNNNILHLTRTKSGTSYTQLIARRSVANVPEMDSVKISWQMKYSNTTHALMWDGVFNLIGHNKVQLANGHTFEPVGTEQIAALNTKDVWHIYELVINYTLGTTTLYVDNIQIGAAGNSTFALSKIDLLLPRHIKESVGNVYIDNLKVAYIPDPEWVTMAEILNGQKAGSVTENLNLMTTKDEYSIEWESSKPEVISIDGVVTPPAFLDESVTLTAKISLTATEASVGTSSFDLVVPSSGEVLWSENFDAGIIDTDLVTNATKGYNGWYLETGSAVISDLETAKAEGTALLIKADPDDATNKSLQLTRKLVYPNNPSPVNGGDITNWIADKKIVPAISGGMVSFSGRFWISNDKGKFTIEPFGTFYMDRFAPFSVINNGATYTYTTEEKALLGTNKWNSFNLLLNFDDRVAELYINGRQFGSEMVMSMNSVSILKIYLARNQSGGTHYLDDLTAKRVTMSDEMSVSKALDKVQLDTPAEGVTENLKIENKSFYYGTNIEWVSNLPGTITNDGVVTRAIAQDVEVTLRAIISKNNVHDEKEFTVLVKGISELEYEASQLHFSQISNGQQMAFVTENLSPINQITGTYTTALIEWSSSHNEVLSKDGVVTTPDHNTLVTLTAKLYEESNPEVYVEKDFIVKVLGRGVTVFQDDFESNAYAEGERIRERNGWTQPIYDPHGHEVTLEKDPHDARNYTMRTNKIEQASSSFDVNQEPVTHVITKQESGLVSYSLRFFMTGAYDCVGIELCNGKGSDIFVSQIFGSYWYVELGITPARVKFNFSDTIGISALAINQWHTAELLIDFDRDQMNFYIDGALVKENATFTFDSFEMVRIKVPRFEPLQIWYVDDLLVRSLEYSDMMAVQDAGDALILPSSVSENFVLQALGEYDTSISWESGDTTAIEIVDNFALLKRAVGSEKQVKLFATITRNNTNITKEFPITLTAIGPVENLVSDFSFETFSNGQKAWHLTNNLTLPSSYNGASIGWTVNDNPALFNDGTVVRGRVDVPAVLTATFTTDAGTYQKEFNLVVACIGNILLEENFDVASTEGQSVHGWNNWSIEAVSSGRIESIYAKVKKDINDVLVPYDEADKVLLIERYVLKNGGNIFNQKAMKTIPSTKKEIIRIDFDFLFQTPQSTIYAEIAGMQRHYAISRTGIALKGKAETPFGKTLETSQWYHITIEQDAYNNTYNVYLDYQKLNDEPIYAPGNRTISGINFYSNALTAIVNEKFMIRRVMIRDITPAAEKSVELAVAALSLEDINYDTAIITLPLAGIENTTIAWSSSNVDAISTTGVVTRTAASQEVTLTATISKGSVQTTKEFEVIVQPLNVLESPTTEILEIIAASLNEESITDEPNMFLTKDLVLPTEIVVGKAADIGGVDITWESNYPSIVSADGKITKQPYESAATLTATIKAKEDPTIFVQKQLKFAVDMGGLVYHYFDFEDMPLASAGEELDTWSDISKRQWAAGTEYGTQIFADKEPAHSHLSHQDANHVMFLNRYTVESLDAVTSQSHATVVKPVAGDYYYGDVLGLSFRIKFSTLDDTLHMYTFCLQERHIYVSPRSISISGNTYSNFFSEPLSLNEWHSVGMYFDTLSWRMDLYLDGEFMGSEPFNIGTGPYKFLDQWRFYNDGLRHIYLDDIRLRSFSVPTGEDIVATATEQVTLPQTITEDIALPNMHGQCAIYWESSDESVISDSGKINPATSGTREVVLKATFRYGKVMQTKSFTVSVPPATVYDRDFEVASINIVNKNVNTISIKRVNETVSQAKMVVLVYEQNSFVGMYYYDLPAMAAGTTQNVVTDISLENLKNYKVKAYVWGEDLSGNQLASNYYEKEEKAQ